MSESALWAIVAGIGLWIAWSIAVWVARGTLARLEVQAVEHERDEAVELAEEAHEDADRTVAQAKALAGSESDRRAALALPDRSARRARLLQLAGRGGGKADAPGGGAAGQDVGPGAAAAPVGRPPA